MAQVTLRGNPCNLAGELPAVGADAPAFNLTAADLSPVTLDSTAGMARVLVVVPSLDTPVCQAETRKFNEQASAIEGATVIVASSDLPFAMKRFCTTEGIENLTAASDLRDRGFGERYGVAIADGPLQGVTARAVFVIDKAGKVAYSELVPEIGQEPDYDKVLEAAKAAAA
jgi:thiol peroxidase